MRICCDENIKRSITSVLRQEGHDVVRVQDVLDLGDEDDEIVAFCREEGPVLLTNDADFFQYDSHPRVLFLHEQRASPRRVVTAVRRINRAAPDLGNQVWHVPDGWV